MPRAVICLGGSCDGVGIVMPEGGHLPGGSCDESGRRGRKSQERSRKERVELRRRMSTEGRRKVGNGWGLDGGRGRSF